MRLCDYFCVELKSQWSALQQYTARLQDDFDHNLKLLDERDLELLQREGELQKLQQQYMTSRDRVQTVSQELAVAKQGMSKRESIMTNLLLRTSDYSHGSFQSLYPLVVSNTQHDTNLATVNIRVCRRQRCLSAA